MTNRVHPSDTRGGGGGVDGGGVVAGEMEGEGEGEGEDEVEAVDVCDVRSRAQCSWFMVQGSEFWVQVVTFRVQFS